MALIHWGSGFFTEPNYFRFGLMLYLLDDVRLEFF